MGDQIHKTDNGPLPPLSFPYAWSRRSPSSKAVIAGALKRPRFEDLVRLTVHFGPECLRTTLDELATAGVLRDRAVQEIDRMLRNIQAGVERYRARRH